MTDCVVEWPCVLDVDDAIWASRPGAPAAVARLARRAAIVVAGNAFLADWFSAHAPDVRIVPTAIDTEVFRPPAEPRAGGRFVIGWTGTSPNYEYVAEIESVLARFLRDHDAELLFVADRPPEGLALPADRVRFVRWTPRRKSRVFPRTPEYTPAASQCHTSTAAPRSGRHVEASTTISRRARGTPVLPSVMSRRTFRSST